MSPYYYAGGKRVDLQPDKEHVAVDRVAARTAGLDATLSAAAKASASGSAIVLVAPRSSVPVEDIERLRAAGAIQSVYRHDRAVVVVMPEVRIEFDNPQQRSRVMKTLGDPSKYIIVEETSERVIVRPVSGRGDDALKLANRIHEKAKPASVSPRFVQFVPNPDTRTR